MSTTPLRCILVGTINRGERMISLLLNFDPAKRFEFVGLVDKTAEIARGIAEQKGWGNMPCFGSLQEAVEKVEAEAAILASPARFHGEQTRICLEAGLHVFVAKPLTYDLAEAEQLVELAEKKGRCLLVDQQSQFLTTERTLGDWMHSRKYGDVLYVEFSLHRHRPTMGAFTSDNPFIWEQGVHSFNSLIAILGRPAVAVYSRQYRPSWSVYNGPTACFGEIEFEGGLHVHYLGAFESQSFTYEMRFECEKGAVRAIASGSFNKQLEVALPGEAFKSVGIQDADEERPAEMFSFDAFYQGIVKGGRVVNDGRDNLRTLAVVDAFIRSSKTGQRELVKQY